MNEAPKKSGKGVHPSQASKKEDLFSPLNEKIKGGSAGQILMAMESDAEKQTQDTEQIGLCEICGTSIEPVDPGWSQLTPLDGSRAKSWTPNMSAAFHREFETVGPQLAQMAYWLEQEVHGLASTVQMFIEKPHVQDLFGDRLCNMRSSTDYLIGRMQFLAALLARLDVEHGYQPSAPTPVPLAPPGWRYWTRTHLPL